LGSGAGFLCTFCYNSVERAVISTWSKCQAKGARASSVPIRGIEQWTPSEIEAAVRAGGRFVFFEYCISLIFLTLRQPTGVYFLRANEWGFLPALRCTLISLLLGWWGIPWGVIYTPLTVLTNLSGGRDVTAEVEAMLGPSVGQS
jgi:hypothetical protein